MGLLRMLNKALRSLGAIGLLALVVYQPVYAASVSPGSVDFGDVSVGSSGSVDVTISFFFPESLNSITITGSGFTQTDNCVIVGSGQVCTSHVVFSPSARGSYSGTLRVRYDDGNNTILTTDVPLSGRGVFADLSVFPSSINFGELGLASPVATRTVEVSNTGNADMYVETGRFSVSNGFTQANNCPNTLLPGEHCVVEVSFTPGALGETKGTLGIYARDARTEQRLSTAVSLTANVVKAEISVDPAVLDFGNLPLGISSAAQTAVVRNTGTGVLTLQQFTITPDYSFSSHCPGTLGPGESCNVDVLFTPSVKGPRPGELVVNGADVDGVTALSAKMSLTGNGVQAELELNPQSLDFGTVPVGIASATQTLVVANNGLAALTLNAPEISGDFTQTNNCGSGLDAQASCTVNVVFTPSVSGARAGVLKISGVDENGVRVLQAEAQLTGIGGLGELAVNPASVDFSGVPVGTHSGAQVVTVSNTGTAPLNLDSIATSGDFSQTNDCGSVLDNGAHCTVSVIFSPASAGALSGMLSVSATDTLGQTPIQSQVALSGAGLQAVLMLNPQAMSFPDTPVNTTSLAQQMRVMNSGNGMMYLDSIVVNGAFSQSNSCGSTLDAGASCIVEIRFAPINSGAENGVLTVNGRGSDGQSPLNAQATLSGVGSQASIVLDPQSVNFPDTPVMSASSSQQISVKNTGNGLMYIDSVSVNGDFTQTSTCGTTLDAGGSCVVDVQFVPQGPGPATATVTVAGRGSDGRTPLEAQATVSGVGVIPELTVTPSALDFGEAAVNSTSGVMQVTVQNTGNALMQVVAVSIQGDFSQSNHCATVNAGASCTVDVRFSPVATGYRSGSLAIEARSENGQIGMNASVSLSGIGVQANLEVSPTNVTFPGIVLGGTSSGKTITVSNTGSGPLTLNSISVSGDFTQSNDCGSSLAGGGSCRVTVSFTPRSVGTIQGGLVVRATDSDGVNPLQKEVSLSGKGIKIEFAVEGSANFKDVLPRASSDPQPVTIVNINSIDLLISSIEVTGEFSLHSNDCGAMLPAGGRCSVSIIYSPQDAGTTTGALIVRGSQQIPTTYRAGSGPTGSRASTAPFSVSVPLQGSTMSRQTAQDILDDDTFTGGNPNVISVVEVIADTCASGRVKDKQLQLDCDALVAAAKDNDPGTRHALSEITPERAIKSSRLVQQGGQVQISNVNSRIAALRSGATGFSGAGLAFSFGEQRISGSQLASMLHGSESGGSAGEDEGLFGSRWGGFVTGTLSFGDKDGSELDSGLDFDTTGITAGIDYRISNQLVIGGAIGYIKTSADFDANGGNLDDKGFSLTAYGSYYLNDRYFVDVSAAYGWHDFDQRRHLSYALQTQSVSVDQTARASYNGGMISVSVGTGYDFNFGGWTVGPRANLDYINSDVDSFREKMSDPNSAGGGWASKISGTDQTWLTTALGGKATYAMSLSWGVLTPYARVDWMHEFKNESQLISGAWADDPQSQYFRLRTEDPDQDYFRTNLGVSAVFTNGIIGFIDYNTILSNDHWNRQTISAGLRMEF